MQTLYERFYADSKPNDALQKQLEELRSKDLKQKQAAARAIRHYVIQEARERSEESFAKMLNMLLLRISSWSLSSSNSEKIGCILLLDELIDALPVKEMEKKMSQFANELSVIIVNQNKARNFNSEVVDLAVRSLGHLASGNPIYTAVIVDAEVKRALEWIDGGAHDSQRYTAVLVLKEMALKAPTLFYKHTDAFFKQIWKVLVSQKVDIRKEASLALRHALRLVQKRASRKRTKWYEEMFDNAKAQFPQLGQPWNGSLSGSKDKDKESGSSSSPGRKLFKFSLASASRSDELVVVNSSSVRPSKDVASIHGALLIFYELIGESLGVFISSAHFTEIFISCVWLKEIREHKSSVIREAVMNLLPRIAWLCPIEIIEDFVETCMVYLMGAIETSQRVRKTSFRSPIPSDGHIAFLAMGKLAVVSTVLEAFEHSKHLRDLLVLIRHSLHIRKRVTHINEALLCLTAIVETHGVPDNCADVLVDIATLLIKAQLSIPMISALAAIGNAMPNQLEAVEPLLLSQLTSILAKDIRRDVQNEPQQGSRSRSFSNSSVEYTGSSHNLLRESVGEVAPKRNARTIRKMIKSMASSKQDLVRLQHLALRTLAVFRFEEADLVPLVCNYALRYLNSSDLETRGEAILVTCQVMSTRGRNDRVLAARRSSVDRDKAVAVAHIVERLVIAALTDREPMIRKLVVERLLCDFSKEILMNRENTLSFFTLAQDQFFDIRAIAVSALGELAGRRPCELMPKLQLVLVRLMSELEYAGTVKQQEEATTLIGLLVRAMGQELSSPYISTIVRTFLSKLEDSTSPVIAAMLATLGEIALVCGEVPLQEVLSTVLPVILGVIEDPQSTPLQLEVALSSLAKIASNAVVSIWPYFYHRQLLDCILTLLMSASSSTSLRRQCMVTIGTLGALDPWLHKVNQKNFASGDPGVPYLQTHRMREEKSMPQVVNFEAKENRNQMQNQSLDAATSRGSGPDEQKQFLWRSKLPSFYGVKMPLNAVSEASMPVSKAKASVTTTRRRSEILGTTDRPSVPLKARRKSSQASFQRADLMEAAKTRSKSSTEKTEVEGEGYRRKSSIRQMLEVAVLSTQRGTPKAGKHTLGVQSGTGQGEGKDEDMQHQLKRMRSFEEAEWRSVAKGAMLPSVQRFNLDRNNEETGVNAVEPSSILPSMVSHIVDYYPTVAITALTKLLKDANASSSNKAVLDSTILIFRSLGDRCAPFLPGILGPILQVVQLNALSSKTIDQRVGYVEELGNLLDIVGERLGPFLDEIFMLAVDLWDSDLLEQVLQVLLKLVSRLDPKKVHLPLSILLKPLLALLCRDQEAEHAEGMSVDLALKVLAAFRSALNNYLHLVLPGIVALIDRSTFSSGVVLRVRLAAMDALNQIIRACSVADFATLIVHPLVHALEDISSDTLQYSNLPKKVAAVTSSGNVETAIDAVPVNKKERIEQRVLRQIVSLLTSLVYKLEEEYVMFAPIIDEPLRDAVAAVFGANYQSFIFSAKTTSTDDDLELVDLYFHLVQRVIYGQAIDKPLWSTALGEDVDVPLQELAGVPDAAPGKRGHSQSNDAFRHEMDLNNLRDAWDTSQSSTEEDWIEWMRSFALELLKESPQQALRACFRLAQVNEALGLDLFNAEMDSGRQETLIDALEHALKSQNVPNELLQTLLNLAEFMEHTDNALPMDIRMLSDLALRCQAHAKALHYRELEFQASPHTCIEELIAINNNLEQPEAAAGIVVYARKTYPDSIEVEPWWYERLKKWEEALSEYERKQSEASAKGEEANRAYDLGKLRCFQALGDWSSTASFAIERWKHIVGLKRAKSSFDDAHGRRPGSLGLRLNPKALKLDDNQDKAISYLQEVLVDSFPGVSSSLLPSDANTFYLRDAINTAHPIATLISSRTEHKANSPPVPMLYERSLQMDRIQRAASESSAFGLEHSSRSLDSVNTPGGTISSYAQTVASLGAHALWVLERWDEMASFVSVASAGNIDGCFLRIVYALHQQDYQLTQSYIDHAYHVLGTKLSTLVVESYGRAYPRLVKVQQLRELEEILKFKRTENDSPDVADEYLGKVKRLWTQRLHGMQQSVEVLLPTMVIRSLVVHPEDDVDAWLNFAKVCRKQGRVRLTLKVLMNLGVGSVPHYILSFTDGLVSSGQQPLIPSKAKRTIQAHPRVALAYLKHLWTVGFQTEALKRLRELSEIAYGILDKRQEFGFSSTVSHVLRERSSRELSKAMRCFSFSALPTMELRRLLVSCLCRLGTWISAGVSPGDAVTPPSRSARGRLSITGTIAMSMAGRERRSGYTGINLVQGVEDVLGCYELATQLDKHSYKAWHAWALANYRALAISDGSNVTRSNGNLSHVLAAMEGFFQSITLGKNDNVNVLQDILRLLTLWLTHRDEIPVMGTISRGFELLPIDTWLDVIPQLIARIRSPGDLVCELLEQIGREHPQVLIYPLTVASKSDKPHRAKAALQVMKVMQKDFPVIVNEALVVSRELIRIAVLWNEMWHEGLEEACRLYFSDKRSAEEMIAVLAPLHALMEQGPETMHEVAFYHAFGRDLQIASEWLYKYNTTPNAPATYLNQAWDLYYNVFKAISSELDHHPLELKFISPGLLQAKHLQLAVPGSYKAGAELIRIEGFSSTVKIMPSKQRPRVVALRGSDGETHRFLLKGHEDLRMDERAMQLFTLVNTLLSTDANTNKQNLEIQGYKVVPLSSKAGVLGWVANTDTLHKLIKEYRENRKILVNIEHKLMIQMAPEYERLTVPQKIEVLNYALEETSGQDLARVLWLKSQNSEVWLERRTNYVRSLATMSMVGYILGLGDRHPSNLMLDRESGKIVHIDFGDCFEVTMDREKFSEKVPFRLTRMLINAMEASKIEGNYRYTCKLVMQVLRENHESVMTMLEAFVHDPLITWRILGEPVVPNDDELDTPFRLQPRLPLPYAQSSGSDFKNAGYSSSSGSGTSASSSDEELVEAQSTSVSASASTVKLNQKAVKVIARVRAKLQGQDFTTPLGEPLVLDVSKQVDRLIEEASSRENLCQLYLGWCPFW